jgi:hypothetical protein
MKKKTIDTKKMSDQELMDLAIKRLKGRELFPESNRLAREMLKKIKVPEGLLNPKK